MALKDLFKSKAQKAEEEKNLNLLKTLLFMAVSDDNLTKEELGTIQHIMIGPKGMDPDKSLAEIKSMLQHGIKSNITMPETDEEKHDFFVYLTTVMLMDQKIEKQEWDFLLLMVKAMYNVDDTTAKNMVINMCKQLIDTGKFKVTEINIE